jgi:hypothetical protein
MNPRVLKPLDDRNIAYRPIFFKRKFNKKGHPLFKGYKKGREVLQEKP